MDSKIKKHAIVKYFFISVPIFMAIMLTSTQCENTCDDEIVNCTKEFAFVSLQLKDPDGQPVLLDSTRVFWVSQNRYLEQNSYWWNSARQWGNYIIVDDNMQRELQGRQETMRFTGYLNDEIVYERNILVGADLCHVKYLGTEPLTAVVEDK
jgi:hypothetical protein